MKKILIPLLLLFVLCPAHARVVSGKVTCGKKGLAKVLVTDGENFALTSCNGKYSIEVDDDAEFVYIITPAGYVADWSSGVPAFYRSLAGESFDFDLQKHSVPKASAKNRYHILAVSDPQPRRESHFQQFLGAPLSDLVQTAAALDAPAVGVVLGDICFDVYEFQPRWKEEIVRVGIPFYPVVGNHDHNKAYVVEEEAINTYQENFGPENYAFFLGKDLVVVLDNIIYSGRHNYVLGYTDERLEWLEKLLTYVPKNAHVYIAQHSPLNGRYYANMIKNHEKILDLLKEHQAVFLSGHNHTNGVFQYNERAIEHNVGSICGTHWDTYHCADGTPSGYKVLSKSAAKLSWYYKSVGKPKDFQLEIFPFGSTRLHPESLIVNVWDYDDKWKVEWYQDGEYKGKMEQVDDYSPIHTEELRKKYEGTGKTPSSYRHTKKAHHFFKADPVASASGNASLVTIVVTDRFDNVYKEEIKF